MIDIDLFSDSEELAELIYRSGWSLYDLVVNGNQVTSWDGINNLKPIREFRFGNNYMFIPNPRDSQTLRDAYSITKGLGPAIQLSSLDDHADMNGEGAVLIDDKLTYLFTRLLFEEDYHNRRCVIATSPPTSIMPSPPALIIPSEHTLRKFKKHYKTITPEDLKRKSPGTSQPFYYLN